MIPPQFFVAAPNIRNDPNPENHHHQYILLKWKESLIPSIRTGSTIGAPYFFNKTFVGGPKNTTGTYQMESKMLYYKIVIRQFH